MKTIIITGGSGFIGCNAVPHFLKLGWRVINLDVQRPLALDQINYWKKCDLMDLTQLMPILREEKPDFVLHLAARAECDENTTVESGYQVNTQGTRNLAEAIQECGTVERLIVTSSQFVCGPGYYPKHDQDYRPATVYGQSKAITEEITRKAGLKCAWTVVRPTNIWGPWHQRYLDEFWRIAAKGWYVHPGGKPVVRCYGYVGNIVDYFERILAKDESKVNKKTFYLSDPEDDIYHWANAFCKALNGKSALKIPRPVLAALGLIGDGIGKLQNKPFYINSSRYKSMTSDYRLPERLTETYSILGRPSISLEQGVSETIQWLEQETQLKPSSSRSNPISSGSTVSDSVDEATIENA